MGLFQSVRGSASKACWDVVLAKVSITDLELSGKRVLVRVDFNVPLEHGNIVDDTRIRASLPTIRHILQEGALPVLMSHLGRPSGQVVPELSLKPVGRALSDLLACEVVQADNCVGEHVADLVKNASEGSVVLLENLRFQPGEEGNDPGFACDLAELGEVYINDAFGTAHRAHASTEGVTHYFVDCAAGLLMQTELNYLGGALADPASPFVAIMGGAKISGKIDVIEHLLPIVDTLLIGGGMAFTFYKAMGLEIGKSIFEEDRIEVASNLLEMAKEQNVELLLPLDNVIAAEISPSAPTEVVGRDRIPAEKEGLDIGPQTRELFSDVILKARTIVWNGPLGVCEVESFSHGSRAVAEALALATDQGATTIVGGGETAAAVADFGVADRLSHVSTGGGASL